MARAASLLIFLVCAMSKTATAQYAEWYLDCTIVKRQVPHEATQHPYATIEKISIYMSFDNGGNLHEEGAEIAYKLGSSPEVKLSPLNQFNVVRFKKGGGLATGNVHWDGSEQRAYPRRWSISGDLKVDDANGTASYSETLTEGTATVGFIHSKCVFNNPN